MTLKKPLSVALVALMMMLTANSGEAVNLVVNGDFESGALQDATNWTDTNVDGSGGWRASGGNPLGSFILNSGGSLANDPTITQTIVGLVEGLTYTISGDYILAFLGASTVDAFGVEIAGQLWEFDVPNVVPNVWTSFSETFTFGVGGSTLLRLTGERHDDTAPRVDNIVLELAGNGTAPVPEPGTLLLIGFGLAGFGARVWRRRR